MLPAGQAKLLELSIKYIQEGKPVFAIENILAVLHAPQPQPTSIPNYDCECGKRATVFLCKKCATVNPSTET
jgi:hypothetical protein